jgi:hypothetical protein
MADSPNEPEIQVGDLMKHFNDVPSSFARLGTICIELDPLPITPTFLFSKS